MTSFKIYKSPANDMLNNQNYSKTFRLTIIILTIIAITLFFISTANQAKRIPYQENQTEKIQQHKTQQAQKEWKQHSSILKNDLEKTKQAYETYCTNIDITSAPNCINTISPRLETYKEHIKNAQNFTQNNKHLLPDQQELLATLDEHSIYTTTLGSSIK
jgi:hypothetical protein